MSTSKGPYFLDDRSEERFNMLLFIAMLANALGLLALVSFMRFQWLSGRNFTPENALYVVGPVAVVSAVCIYLLLRMSTSKKRRVIVDVAEILEGIGGDEEETQEWKDGSSVDEIIRSRLIKAVNDEATRRAKIQREEADLVEKLLKFSDMSVRRKSAVVVFYLFAVFFVLYGVVALLGFLPAREIPLNATPTQEMMSGKYDWIFALFGLMGAMLSVVMARFLRIKITRRSKEELKKFMDEMGI